MKHLTWSICLLVVLLDQGLCTRVTYNGDQVLKVTPQTPEQAHYLQELTKQWRRNVALKNKQSIELWKKMLDLWKPDVVEEIYSGRDVHVQVQVANVQQMKENLGQQNIPYKIMIEDMQNLIDSQPVSQKKGRAISLDTYTYTEYHPMEEIDTWMDLIKDKHSNLLTKHLLGHTYEEHPIYYFKIGLPSVKTKKVIFMDCGIHAREWIAVAYCQWFMKEITARQDEPLIQKLLKQIDFYVVPVLNVDGYIFTFTTDRLWRKNRSPHNNGTCFGVDLNRNFNSHWGTVGMSRDCQSLIFCGPNTESELETQGVVNLLEPLKSNLLMYLTIHSFGQYILLPYGHKYAPSVNHYEMMMVGEKAAAEIKEKHNSHYMVGSSSVMLYYTSGSSADWAFGLDILFSYTYELRDEGSYGFVLPPDQIEPTCEETWTSMVSLFGYLNDTYLGPLVEDDDDDNNGAAAISSHWLHVIFSLSVCIYYALIR